MQICAGTQTPCAANNIVASYSTGAARTQDRVRVDAAEEAYIATWTTQGAGLDPAKTYRIHVLVGAVELGHADIDVIRTAAERRTVQPGSVPLVNGAALPVRFRIEQGVIAAEVIGSEGGEVSSSDGGVTLSLPAGAVEDGTVITIQGAGSAADPNGRLIGGRPTSSARTGSSSTSP